MVVRRAHLGLSVIICWFSSERGGKLERGQVVHLVHVHIRSLVDSILELCDDCRNTCYAAAQKPNCSTLRHTNSVPSCSERFILSVDSFLLCLPQRNRKIVKHVKCARHWNSCRLWEDAQMNIAWYDWHLYCFQSCTPNWQSHKSILQVSVW